MKQSSRKHRIVAVTSTLVALLIFCWLWGPFATIRGSLAARVDIHRGRYQVLGYGLPSPSRPEYARCLRERYGIEFRTVAGCIVSDSLISYVNGYHSVVAESTTQKFGHDVFEECAKEANKKWSERQARMIQNVGSR